MHRSLFFCLMTLMSLNGRAEANTNGGLPSDEMKADKWEEPSFRLVRKSRAKWLNGEVFYNFRGPYTSEERSVILSAMREIEENTNKGDLYCIRFTEWNGGNRSRRYLLSIRHEIPRPDNSSSPPINATHNRIMLVCETCFKKHGIMVQLMRELGFLPEHIRPDRDDYIVVNATNKKWSNLFKKQKSAYTTIEDIPYDYSSIMHNRPYEDAVDPSWPTLYPKKDLPSGVTVGRKSGLSKLDVMRIQKVYECLADTTYWSNAQTKMTFSCDFQNDFCKMTQGTDDDFNWKRTNKGRSTNGTGPNRDHTTGNGYYVMAEASGQATNSTARLRTPNFGPGVYCLRFFLYFYGADIGELTVHTESDPYGNEVRFRERTCRRNFWTRHSVNLTETSSWRLLVEVAVGTGPKGNVAIDDLTIVPGNCRKS